MTSCTICGTTIVFGGVRHGKERVCSKRCKESWEARSRAIEVLGRGELDAAVASFHAGRCPVCGRDGPIDVRTSLQVISFGIASITTTEEHVGCDGCSKGGVLSALLTTAVFGWWSIFGIGLAPFAIARDIAALLEPRGGSPSPALERHVLLRLVTNRLQRGDDERARSPTAQLGGDWF